jgi:DNA-binding HxlR family transcriptional regulator
MLTNTLRDLDELGIIHREQFNEIPPHVEYSLTEKGKALLPVFFEISK